MKREKDWVELLPVVVNDYNKGYKSHPVHSTTGLSPNEAEKDENALDVKLGIVMKSHRDRIYPPLSEGDKVKVYRKKGKLDKETTPVWLPDTYTIGSVVWDDGREHYSLVPRPVGLKQWYMRTELKKV